jgi:murein DD-endopeptidase MepM/ murein hydrolase activator NlpD
VNLSPSPNVEAEKRIDDDDADTTGPQPLWLWPVPVIRGHRPVISDGFDSMRGAALHAGVDLMFRRATRSELVGAFPPGTPNGTALYFMWNDTLVLAASAGRVWSAAATPRGYQVVIDHGRFATLYQHLERLTIDERLAGPNGPTVEAGQPLGVVGGDPTDASRLKHLHFELWRGRTRIDPEPAMRSWQLLEISGHTDVDLRGQAGTTREPALLPG